MDVARKKMLSAVVSLEPSNISKFKRWQWKFDHFSAIQLDWGCYLPNNASSNTNVTEYNTTAGPDGEMAVGEIIIYDYKKNYLPIV